MGIHSGKTVKQADIRIPEYLQDRYFPDAPTERGIKHIRELIKAKKAGYKAILAFVIQMDGVTEVRPNVGTHPEFGETMDDARKAGVEIRHFTCHVTPDTLEITGRA